MKKMLLAGVIVLSLVACDAGSSAKGWSEDNKNDFLKECVSGSKQSAGMNDTQANEYCSCMMGKLEAKYPNAIDVTKASDTEMDAFAAECNQ